MKGLKLSFHPRLLAVVIGLTLPGLTDSAEESSNLMDDIYRKDELHNEQEFQIALDKPKSSEEL